MKLITLLVCFVLLCGIRTTTHAKEVHLNSNPRCQDSFCSFRAGADLQKICDDLKFSSHEGDNDKISYFGPEQQYFCDSSKAVLVNTEKIGIISKIYNISPHEIGSSVPYIAKVGMACDNSCIWAVGFGFDRNCQVNLIDKRKTKTEILASPSMLLCAETYILLRIPTKVKAAFQSSTLEIQILSQNQSSNRILIQKANLQGLSSGPIPYTGTITITMIRHAQACHNVLSKFRKNKRGCRKERIEEVRRNIIDPPVTNIGIEKGTDFSNYVTTNKEIANHDAIFTSSLMRNIQSALLSFPNEENIYLVPFVKETGGPGRNDPETLKQQTEYLQENFDSHEPERINHSLLPENIPLDTSNWEKFKTFFGSTLITNSPKELKDKIRNNEDVAIILFTHCSFMRDHIIKRDDYDCQNLYQAKFKIEHKDDHAVDDDDDSALKGFHYELSKESDWKVVGTAESLRPQDISLEESDLDLCVEKYGTIYENWINDCFKGD